MGIGTILKAKRVILLAWGEAKASVVSESVEGEISNKVPASYLQKHKNAIFVVDYAASAKLTRIKTPWLTAPCYWDDKTIKKGVTWLSQEVQKSILKLTDRDYNDHGMSDLVSFVKSADKINTKIFNCLQDTVAQNPGSFFEKKGDRRKKKIFIFSPHPDDDVICMGGTMMKLVQQGYDVYVAYQTTGNIAVFDDDVVHFASFVDHYNDMFNKGMRNINEVFETVVKFFENKKSGQVDSQEVLKIKSLIRMEEARNACRFMGIRDDHITFLHMPFYCTGKIKKKPLSKQDIKIIVDVLQKVKPDQIYAAGDLSDPHGTHRICLSAIFSAFEVLKREAWLQRAHILLYRGAWQEWEIDQIDMAVPLSPDELTNKIKAIFKHQSQKDSALFPGFDKREFWQRARDRNKATAALYDSIGLAEYEAMEVFVRYDINTGFHVT
jgi:glucosamine-6-phosphate deaminase